jgi:hypothetical protein
MTAGRHLFGIHVWPALASQLRLMEERSPSVRRPLAVESRQELTKSLEHAPIDSRRRRCFRRRLQFAMRQEPSGWETFALGLGDQEVAKPRIRLTGNPGDMPGAVSCDDSLKN